MGPRERREREREEIRTRILDAARDLFAAEGYEAVTMRKIADRIEYSATAIYFHFRDKETLLKELCETDFRSLSQEFAAVARIGDPIDRLKAVGLAYFRFGINYPNHYRLMFMTPRPPVASEIHKGNPEEDAYALVKSIVAQALAEKRFRKEYHDVELISQTVWAGVHGVVSLHIAKATEPWIEWSPLEKRAKVMIDVLVDGLVR